MKLSEAISLLDGAPADDTPAALNPLLTKAHAVKIVRAAVASFGRPKNQPCGPDDEIDPLMEKRVYQVARNQSRPRY